MDEGYLAQILMFGGNFAPRAWAFCNGQLIAISQNTALFSLLGTTFGGDGRTTFGLPEMRGRAPIGTDRGPGLSNRTLGEKSGLENVTLTINEIPSHTHSTGTNPAQQQHIYYNSDAASNHQPQEGDIPSAAVFGDGLSATTVKSFGPVSGSLVKGQAISANAGLIIGNTGGNQSHYNMQPYLGMNFVICMQGMFPSRS